tara:strand:+ start:33445 stop:37767 length:4323 start_codon:yes stop_codon:yes gene_type:complete
MSCNVQIRTFEYLEEKDIIEENGEINDLIKFNEVNDALSKLALEKYNVGANKQKLFTTKSKYVRNFSDGSTRYILKAEANDELFNILQDAINNYVEQDLNPPTQPETGDEIDMFRTFEGAYLPLIDDNESEKINSVLFNNEVKESYSAKEIINNIINNYNTSKLGKDFLEKLKFAAELSNAHFVPNSLKEMDGSVMYYHRLPNAIRFSRDNFHLYSLDLMVRSVLHEVMHSITVNSYQHPSTIEQKMFNEFIDEAFKFYKSKANKIKNYFDDNGSRYGFTSPTEFIAEIFSNSVFASIIQKIDREEDNPSFFTQLYTWIRRLLSLPLKSKINNKINYDNIIASIMEFSESNESKEFSFRLLKEADEYDEKHMLISNLPIYTNLRTIDEKLDHSIDRIEESINRNISTYKWLAKVIKNDSKTDNIKEYIGGLNTLLTNVTIFRHSNKIKAVSTFTNLMLGSLDYVKRQLDSVDHTDPEKVMNTVKIYKNYLSTYSVIHQLEKVMASIREDHTQTVVTSEELAEIEREIIIAKGNFSYLEVRVDALMQKGMAHYLNNIRYFPQVEKKHRERLYREHRQSEIPEPKEAWVSKMLQGRDAQLVQEDLTEKIQEVISNPSYDIYSSDVLMSSAINVSAPLIQIMNQMLFEIDNRRISSERVKDQEFRKGFEQLTKEKGTNNITTLYKNILDKASTGKNYLKGDYRIEFYTDVHQKMNTMRSEYREKKDEFVIKLKELADTKGINSAEYIKTKQESLSVLKSHNSEIGTMEVDNFELDDKGIIIKIKDKWKSDFSNMTAIEKEVLAFFTEITQTSDENTYGENTLIKYSFGTKFYELPKITKSDAERIWNTGKKGILSDKWKDLTEVRPDDVGFVSRETDLGGNQIRRLRVHYRDRNGSFKNRNQSLDLMSIYRLEYKNGNMYKMRRDMELELNFLLDIAKSKPYHQKEGSRKTKSASNKKLNIIQGIETNTSKMMTNMLESRFYDILNRNSTTFGKIDMNKAVGFINGASAFLTLSLNIASGTANVVNANAQIFLESIIKGMYITKTGVAKANKIYGLNMAANLKDITAPINMSFVNQVNEMFNIRGLFNLSNASFLKSDLMKAGLDLQSLQVFQDSGEHWIQSVIAMSTLDGVKVMDANNNLLNKAGKIVKTEKAAASVLDMMVVDKHTGVVNLSDKVVYTTHSRITKWDEGGKEKVDMLIRKMLYTTIGNYTEIDQPEVMRHWAGKLGMLYRKYFTTMGQARLRGWETAGKRKEDLTDDEKRFSYALQEDEEGSYVTLIRYLRTTLRDKKFWILSKGNWNNLSDYEKYNLRKAVTEIILTSVLLPLATSFVKSLAANDDSEYLYFLAYQLRRLDTELSAYRDPREMFKMMRSPIPSARLIETGLNILTQLATPWNLDEVYKAGQNKNKNKFRVKLAKQFPVIKEFYRTYQDLFEYQSSSWGTR